MSNVVSRSAPPQLPPASVAAGGVLLLWLVLTGVLAARGGFLAPPGEPPLALAAGFGLPLAAFFAAYRGWPAFRAWVLGFDLRLITTIQAQRFLGFAFIALYAQGSLPGLFAWPAGLGDMLVAATAPWVGWRLAREPGFASSRSFRRWNWLGIADLLLAVTLGVLASGLVPGLVGVTTAPLARLPLVLVPAYLVPLMLMLHAAALLQARRTPG